MNNKSLFERMSNIMNRGSEKWLSRSLREEEGQAETNYRNDTKTLSQRMANSRAGRADAEGRPQPRSMSNNAGGNQPPRPPVRPVASGGPEREPEGPKEPQEIGPIQDSETESQHQSIQERHAQAISEHKERMRGILKEESDLEDETYGPLREALQQLQSLKLRDGGDTSEEQREQFLNMVAYAQTYPGKQRKGQGQQLLHRDAERLADPTHQASLRAGYGDGSPEQIKEMVEGRLLVDTPMEIVQKLWNALPNDNEFKKYLKTAGGQNKKIDIWDEEKGESKPQPVNLNYQGKDADGNDIHGGNTKARHLLLFKRYLDQMGKDGYTGFDLDPRFMDLEHVRGTSSLTEIEDGTMRPPTIEEFKKREHEDNWMWIAAGINNRKSQGSMDDLLESVDKQKDQIAKGESEWGVNLDQSMEDVANKESGIESMASGIVQEEPFDGKLKDLNEGITPEMIETLLDNELNLHQQQNPKTTKIVEKGLARRLWQQMGLANSFQTNGLRSIDLNMIRPMVMNIAKEQDPEKRQSMIKSFQDTWLPRRAAARAMAGGEDSGEFESFRKTKPKDGSLNLNATFDDMMDEGLLGLETPLLTKKDLENERYFPNPKTRATIKKRHPRFWGDGKAIEEETTTWHEELELHVNSQLVL